MLKISFVSVIGSLLLFSILSTIIIAMFIFWCPINKIFTKPIRRPQYSERPNKPKCKSKSGDPNFKKGQSNQTVKPKNKKNSRQTKNHWFSQFNLESPERPNRQRGIKTCFTYKMKEQYLYIHNIGSVTQVNKIINKIN